MPVDKRDESRVNMRDGLRLGQTKTGAGAFTKDFSPVKKSELRAAILSQLRNDLATQTQAAAMARDEAISEESRPENKWDTHSQEAAYLAEGQAKLAAEIGASIELYSSVALPEYSPDAAIAIGAVVEVSAENESSWYFLGPRAGGLQVTSEGKTILVVTPQSPLGRQLLGKRRGDAVPSPKRGGGVPGRIASVG